MIRVYDRWKVLGSKKEKHKEARFIKDKNSNRFIGKAYGHEGQPVERNARLMSVAPRMLDALEYILDYWNSGSSTRDPKMVQAVRDVVSEARGEHL